MTKKNGGGAPSDPQEIMERAAARRAQARSADRDPANWGIAADTYQLPAHQDVEVRVDEDQRRVRAHRSDPFDLLLAAGGLTPFQHRAARRLMRDWCIASGVRDEERPELGKIDGGRSGPQEIAQAAIDADTRRAAALKAIGPVNARLMSNFMRRLVDEAGVMVWRAVVEHLTAEKDRNVQGALVRQACENLVLHYEAEDTRRRIRQDNLAAGKVQELRPFGSAQAA